MRGIAASARLALTRARATPGRWLPLAAPIALAVGLFGALSAAGVVAGDHAARDMLARLGPLDRSVILTWAGGSGPDTDAAARKTLGAVGAGGVTRATFLFPSDFGRAVVRAAGIEPIGRSVRVLSGRLPEGPCTMARCEVFHAAGEKPRTRLLRDRGMHLVVVGRGLVTNPSPFGFVTRPRDFELTGASHQPALLVSGDPAGVDALEPLNSVYRTLSWSAPLPLETLHAWQIDPLVRRIAEQRRELDRESYGFTVASPQLELQAARARSRVANGRLSAAAAAAAAALAAFLVLAAGGLRSGLLAEDARLRRSGATATQRAVLALCETGVPVVTGLLAGVGVAVVVALIRAQAGDVDAAHVLDEALGDALGRIAIVAAAGWALALAAARVPPRAGRALAGVALLVGAALLVGLLAPRDTGPDDPLPGAVIPVAAAAAGLVVALVLPSLLRWVARAAPPGRPLARISLLELAREPGAATIAAAGLAVSVGLAGFAFAYRATLDRSRSDQADHRVPLAATVLPGPDLRSPLAVRPLSAWEGLPGVDHAVPVLRRDAFVLAGPQRDPVDAVAVPAETLGSLSTWRAADAAGDHRELARRLVAAPFDRPPAGLVLPADATSVALPARVEGDNVVIALMIRTPGGRLERVELGTARRRDRVLRAELGRRVRGGTAVALAIEPTRSFVAIAGHQAAEGGGGHTASGKLHLGALRAGSVVETMADWDTHGAVGGEPEELIYHLTGPALLRPDQPSDGVPVPVLADPGTAHDASLSKELLLDVLGNQVPVKVVGTVRRFPTVAAGRGFVLADQAALAGALDAQVPGSGEPRELWLDGETARLDAAAGAAARRRHLALRTRSAVRARIAAEPIAREVLGALAVAALLAAALALLGVAVAVRRALRDSSAALLDLEAQGLGPSALRRGLRLRGAVIAVAGVIPGTALALGLTALVSDAVRAGAVGPPDPPLVTVVPWTTGALAALALLLLAAAGGALAAAPALREPVPRQLPSAELPA